MSFANAAAFAGVLGLVHVASAQTAPAQTDGSGLTTPGQRSVAQPMLVEPYTIPAQQRSAPIGTAMSVQELERRKRDIARRLLPPSGNQQEDLSR